MPFKNRSIRFLNFEPHIFYMTKLSIFWYSDLTKLFVLTNFIMNAVQVKKQAFLKEAGYFFKNASVHAEEGDLQSCAVFILKALDKERRASGVGPQVLHLIKTR